MRPREIAYAQWLGMGTHAPGASWSLCSRHLAAAAVGTIVSVTNTGTSVHFEQTIEPVELLIVFVGFIRFGRRVV